MCLLSALPPLHIKNDGRRKQKSSGASRKNKVNLPFKCIRLALGSGPLGVATAIGSWVSLLWEATKGFYFPLIWTFAPGPVGRISLAGPRLLLSSCSSLVCIGNLHVFEHSFTPLALAPCSNEASDNIAPTRHTHDQTGQKGERTAITLLISQKQNIYAESTPKFWPRRPLDFNAPPSRAGTGTGSCNGPMDGPDQEAA